MTYLEAIIEDLQPYPIRKSLVIRKCEKHGAYYEDDAIDEKLVNICVIEILYQMKTLNAVGEGGANISFNEDKVDDLIRLKCRENGIDSLDYINEPTVTYLGDL